MTVIRFDWDGGNVDHARKHGVSQEEIEYALRHDPYVSPDPYPASIEERWRAIGKNKQGRHLFIVFMFRMIEGVVHMRPISARYMHEKEIESFEPL